MSFKAKLFAWLILIAVTLALAFGIVKKVDAVFKTLKDQADLITALNGEKGRLEDQRTQLQDMIKSLFQDKQAVDEINERLRQQVGLHDSEYLKLKDELRLARLKSKPSVGLAEPDDTLEVDIAWRAYCKALPGGCPTGVTP